MAEIRILVDVPDTLRKFLWIQLAAPTTNKREAISVGFSDAAFVVPGIQSQMMLGNQIHVAEVDLRAQRGEAPIANPHFTFHAPAWMHLRANGETVLLEQLVCMDLAVSQQHRVPWLRFFSKVTRDLAAYAGTRAGAIEEIVATPQSPDDSIAVRLDFVDDPDRAAEQSGDLVNRIIQWHEWLLHLAIDSCPPRDTSTFVWLQQN